MRKPGRPKLENKKVSLSTVLPKQGKVDLGIVSAKLGRAKGDTIAFLAKEYLINNKE